MALRKNLLKIFSSIFPFADFAYILQLEEYDTLRYVKWLPRFFFRRGIQRRETLAYTARVKILLAASVGIYGVLVVIAAIHHALPVALLLSLIATLLIPFIVLVAAAVLSPAFLVAHARMRNQAQRTIAAARGKMRIVMIAGSYGKTTTKGFIGQLATHQFRLQVPPGNINTPSGIAAWIVRDLRASTDLLIIEADGYSRLEYAQTCTMVPADIAVITNIGDQHLERFGSRQALADALAEVFARAHPGAHLIAPHAAADELQKMALGNRTVHAVSSSVPQYRGMPIEALHLSDSQRQDLALALAVADILDIPERFVVAEARTIAVPERRQMRRELYGYDAIDDSYNISFSTAAASIAAASKAAGVQEKKLLVITAGIPELGPRMLDGNKKLGELLAKNADHTIVLGSVLSPEILRGLGNAPHTVLPKLSEFDRLKEHFYPGEWFLLLLPELNDLYY